MGQIDVTLTVVQTGSALNGTMLDTILNWVKTNLINNLLPGWTPTMQIQNTPTQYVVTVRISATNVTVTGTLYDQVLAWIQTNASAKLLSNYALTPSINIFP